mgnify:CR=1 FL=1
MVVKPGKFNDIVGSCYQGSVTIAYEDLVRIFGKPTTFSGDKVSHEWIISIDNLPLTIYDYTVNGRKVEDYAWHIGGKTGFVLDALKKVLSAANVNFTITND